MRQLWRWLTCEHGRHDWHVHPAIDLVDDHVIVGRSCYRCGLVEVLE